MEDSYRPPVVSVSSEQDDVVKSKNQHSPLPEDYCFIREDRSFRLWAGFLYGLTEKVQKLVTLDGKGLAA